MLLKSINEKITFQLDQTKDRKFNGNGKIQGKKNPGGNIDSKDIIHDNNKNHLHWRLKEDENFSKIFYKNQKECPRTLEGKNICMKFFLGGICTKSCPRSHTLSREDKKKFEAFVNQCREGAGKPDF
jgi:hypothetical protein